MDVFVFRTNVNDAGAAECICREILTTKRVHRVNFDLHDHEKILRVESTEPVSEVVRQLVQRKGYECDELN